jgi:restriction system protein
MEAWHSRKGLFFTTWHFTGPAQKFLGAVPHWVILIDGKALADLIINHNIGVEEDERFIFKQVQQNYFLRASKPK